MLERKFATLKERLYIERVTQIEQLLHGVRNGTSNNYLVPLNKLQEEMMTRIHIANQLRRIRLINIKNVFDAEEQVKLYFSLTVTISSKYYLTKLSIFFFKI